MKHLKGFPGDGLEGALENMIAFDRWDKVVLHVRRTGSEGSE